MTLGVLDYVIIMLFFLISLLIGFYYKNKASENITQFFLGGRNLPWWIAGTSMVATTFAADTPLAVTEIVAKNGISGNWLWWSFLSGGMFTTFFFAKNWRRANVLTDLEIIEMRYSGKAASFLRGFRAIYLGIFMNSLIIGWVNLALMSLLQVFFNLSTEQSLFYCFLAMSIVVVYSSISGLLGVAVTDVIQFVIAMSGTVILSILVLNDVRIGGSHQLQSKLDSSVLNFFPTFEGNSFSSFSITIGGFFAFIAIQWWASWYPGAEPGGGGYIAQRMMSAKNEKHAVIATLFFQIAHYCLRPWPWILVALCSLILYPELNESNYKLGYVYAMRDFLPTGLKGLLIVAFFAAYMSTVSTQLNWGASYIVNDFYKRFINNNLSDKNLVFVSRIATIFLMVVSIFVTSKIETISGVWEFIIECGAGLGVALILRWFWWRVNAWSEIVATIAPFIAFFVSKFYLEDVFGQAYVEQKGTYLFTVTVTLILFIISVYVFPKTDKKILLAFYEKIKPMGFWKGIQKNGHNKNIIYLFMAWISSVSFAYAVLFVFGYLILGIYSTILIWICILIISLFILIFSINKSKIVS